MVKGDAHLVRVAMENLIGGTLGNESSPVKHNPLGAC